MAARPLMQREYILTAMRFRPLALAAVLLSAAVQVSIAGPGGRSVPEARARVDHHLREVEAVAGRLGAVLADACPGFSSAAEWEEFQRAREEDVVLLLAHLEQAWAEAKTVQDDDLRRDAKAPRRRIDHGWRLVEKLQACAAENRAALDPLASWTRIEREVGRRQREIALP